MTPPSMPPPSVPPPSVGQPKTPQPKVIKVGQTKRQAQQAKDFTMSPSMMPMEVPIASPLVEALERRNGAPLLSHTLQRTFGPAIAALE